MKEVYFACSIRGGRDDSEIYTKLVEHISIGAIVLTEIFADGKLTSQGMDKPSEEIWKIDTEWISQSDCVIAEVSNPSLGVGYEIALAESLKKPILALYKEKNRSRLSAMIDGAPGVEVHNYTDLSDAVSAIDIFLANLD